MAVQFNEPAELSGFALVIRLKADLLYQLGTVVPSRRPEQVLRFVSAVEQSGFRDRTALVVLLAELCEEIRVLVGAGDPPPSKAISLQRTALKTWRRLPPPAILARFKDYALNALLVSSPAEPPLSTVVATAKTIIDDRYAEPLTLQHLATAADCSTRHLGARFHAEMGMTIHEYLTLVRLRHALGLIRQGEKIEAVSLLVGYRSRANFYRQFKARVGVTPMAYRRALVDVKVD